MGRIGPIGIFADRIFPDFREGIVRGCKSPSATKIIPGDAFPGNILLA